MKVEWSQDEMAYYGDLDIGDTFVVEHIPYIKIREDKYTGFNAVSLFSGGVTHFDYEDYVKEAFFKLVEI